MAQQDTRADSSSQSRTGIRELSAPSATWDPRRSLGARLVLLLLPLFVLPVVFYWLASRTLWSSAREEVAATLTRDAVQRERTSLRQIADRRAAALEEEAAEVVGVGREAASFFLRALREGPAPGGPERLEDVPGGPIRTAGKGESAAMITRAVGVTPVTLRDLAATRRLEPGLRTLIAGHPAISTVFALTSTGVMRAVPWCDVSRLVGLGGMRADFRFPAEVRGGQGGGPTWTPVYEDYYASRGRILTAILPVRGADGELLGEVGVDWLIEDLFARYPEARRRGELEVVFGPHGRALFRIPEESREPEGLFAALRGPGEREMTLGRERYLAAAREIPSSGWTYVRLLPLASLHEALDAELEPVFSATERSRVRLQIATLLLFLVAVVPLVAVARRTTAPIRGLARYADAITRREEPGRAPGTGRLDELGRLARALEGLDGRVRRRIRSMEGLHDLARTGAMMTRPEETYARLSRRIAELVGATKAWFALWDPDARELVFTPPGYGVADEKLRAVRIGPHDHSLTLLAFRTGETYVANDIPGDPRVSRSLASRVEIERNAVIVPLRTEAGTLGVLVVGEKPAPFDEEDQAAIQIYADEAALLLRNARLYEELQGSFERLRDAHRNRDYFLQNINHELRTPLTAILGWSEVLAEDQPDPPTVATAVEQIRRSAQFLLTLISDLLDLSRFEEGRTQLERAATDIGALVREAVEPVAVMAEAKGIRITVSAPEPGASSARLDPLRTRQVLWNLVHNAVKFTHKGGCIEVTAGRDEAAVTFTVADDGVGIDPKDLPFIFERFRQGDGSTTRAYRGTGIGLALAKAYVELHGGKIEAENRPARGATFRVVIPDPVGDSSGALPRPKLRI